MAKSSPKFPEERQQVILERLNQIGRVVALDFAREFDTSEDTIRRDLRQLAKSGFCRRTYGGAVANSPASGTFVARRDLSQARKAALARTAVTLIKPGQLVFFDSGTTNLEIARAVSAHSGITIATNAPVIASAVMAKPGISVILIGGIINTITSAALGSWAVRDIGALNIDLCFLGVCALSSEMGLRGFDLEDVEFKKTLIAHSNVIAAAVTSDKLETGAPFQIAGLSEIDHLILERDADPKFLKRIKQPGLSIHRSSTA
jgi:DeoR/GlpR family transcriptional regulator of sugar metabolism